MLASKAPILGDGKYAGADAHPGADFHANMHLHAQFLRLPDGQLLEAPLPKHMKGALSYLDMMTDVPTSLPDFRRGYNMSDLKIALFDFDGTLCDSASSIVRLTHIACKKADVPLPDEQQIRDNIGEGLFVALGSIIRPGTKRKQKLFLMSIAFATRQELADPEKPVDPLFDGAKQTLEKLSEGG